MIFARLNRARPGVPWRDIGALILVSILIGCTAQQPLPEVTPPVRPTSAPLPNYSANPIIDANENSIFFAQTALKKLGYKVGIVDGIWGPQSAAAIKEFEQKNKLKSANGHLSELNLNALSELSEIEQISFSAKITPAVRGIANKLRQQQESNDDDGPQLIIVDKSYEVMAKPNPYSSQISTLAPGTGIYVLARREGNWYEIESINRLRGFILDN